MGFSYARNGNLFETKNSCCIWLEELKTNGKYLTSLTGEFSQDTKFRNFIEIHRGSPETELYK